MFEVVAVMSYAKFHPFSSLFSYFMKGTTRLKMTLSVIFSVNFYSWWFLIVHRVSLNEYRSEAPDREVNNPHNVTWFAPFLVKRGASWHGAAKSWWWAATARLWKSFHLRLLLYERFQKRISNADNITKNGRQRLAINNSQISHKKITNLIVFDKISPGNEVCLDILKFESYFTYPMSRQISVWSSLLVLHKTYTLFENFLKLREPRNPVNLLK